jgi:DNA repair exonuclease SbcCD ATPase subunit
MLSTKSAKPPAGDASQGADADASQTAESIAERDAKIKELEQALAEERQSSTTLRETIDSLHFKAEVLEKSYAKQLADTRARLAAAEQAVAEHKQKDSAYGTGPEETIRLLKDARTELEQLKLEREQLKAQLRRGQGWSGGGADAAPAEASEGTINQLMAGPEWLSKRGAPSGNSHLEAQVSGADEAPAEQMIDPALVFTKGSKDDE